MKTTAGENRKQIYVTDFKTPILVGACIWLVFMISSIIYFLVKGHSIAEEWQNGKDEVLLLMLGIVGFMTLLPAIGWQRIEIIEWENKLPYRNLWDRILSRTKEFKLNEIASVDINNRPKLGTIVRIVFKDGTTQKINTTNLKKGWELKEYFNKAVTAKE